MMKNIILCLIFNTILTTVYSQTGDNDSYYPEVGKPCPNFVIKNIKYFSKTEASLSDFKGKWLVLDFWNRYCSACVASFPKTNQMQITFANTAQFILVGYNGSWGGIRQADDTQIRLLYNTFRKKERLIVPCAFDSSLFDRFDIGGCPHLIIIDGNSIIRGITSSLDSAELRDLMTGNPTQLAETYWRWHDQRITKTQDKSTPFVLDLPEGKSPFIYYSALSKWNHQTPISIPMRIDKDFKNGKLLIEGIPLYKLYNFAYFNQAEILNYSDSLYGKIYDQPILELKDTQAFQFNYKKETGLYCYSLSISGNANCKNNLNKILQQELNNSFGYSATIENREVPCWKLIATNEAKVLLKHRYQISYLKIQPHLGFMARNCSIKRILGQIWADNQKYIFTDETGITENIDLKLDALMSDLNDVKKALQMNGLDLVQGKIRIKAIVIRDP